MTIDYVVKKKAIDLHLQGRGRNEIARILNGQKMRISEATITHLIQDWKRQQQHQQQQEQVTTTNEPPLQASQSPSQSPQTSQPELLQEQKAATPQQTSPIQDIDFADNPYPESDVYTDPNADYYEQFDGGFNYRYTNPYLNTTFPNNFNQQVSRSAETSEEELDQTSLGIDWDSDKNHQARFVKWVISEKRLRRESERRLQEQWGILSIERKNLEEQKRNFDVRESKYLEVKDLIPSAAELKSMGVDFTLINAFINVVKEYASKKMIDERAAAWRLCEDLKAWQELGGFETAIKNAKHQLSLLDVALEDQRLAIATMVDLRKSGMTEDEIADLTRVVSKWSGKIQNNGSSFKLDTDLNLPNTPQ